MPVKPALHISQAVVSDSNTAPRVAAQFSAPSPLSCIRAKEGFRSDHKSTPIFRRMAIQDRKLTYSRRETADLLRYH